jgi:hypothetical protein
LHRRAKPTATSSTSSKSNSNALRPLAHVETRLSALSLTSTSTPTSYRPELYIDAPARMIREGLVRLLCAVGAHVGVDEGRFEQILDVVEPVLERADVKAALEGSNADAGWLRLWRKGKVSVVGKAPVGRWGFVEV